MAKILHKLSELKSFEMWFLKLLPLRTGICCSTPFSRCPQDLLWPKESGRCDSCVSSESRLQKALQILLETLPKAMKNPMLV